MSKQYFKQILKSETNFKTQPTSNQKHFLNLLLVVILTCIFSDGIAQQKTLGRTKLRKGSMEKGYVLFAPMAGYTTFLMDKCGKEINRWTSKYQPGLSAYILPDGSLLRAGRLFDTAYNAPGRGGILEKYDWNNNLIWSYVISNDSLAAHHDFYPMENGNILVIAWHGIPASVAEAKGRYKGTSGGNKLWSERILEIKPKGFNEAEIVWQWSLIDHIIQDESISKPDFNIISSNPQLMNINYAPSGVSDWIHINSIDYNKDLDQIVLSCHEINEIWIIDHSTTTAQAASHSGGKYGKGGDLLYRWGNPVAYNKGSKANQKLFYQHNAHWIPKGLKDAGDIMIFNNGLSRSPSFSSVEIITPDVSSAGVYKTTIPYGPTAFKWSYKDSVPTNFYSPFVSGAQRLPNGNTLICSGNQGRFFEVGDKNTIVWQYINPVVEQDVILTDGQTAYSNEVFRAVYYSDTFSGFKNKSLTPKGPIEKNSYAYSCTLIIPDVTPPNTTSFIPAKASKNVAITTVLQVNFNETVKKGSSGKVNIYENGKLKESIVVSDSKISVSGSSMIIVPTANFSNSARVSIAIDKGLLTDTASNQIAAIDSSNWAFNTIEKIGSIENNQSFANHIYPNPVSNTLHVTYLATEPKVEIFNNVGQKINASYQSVSNGIVDLDLSQLPNGLYSILVDGKSAQKFIKN
jgi:hypothetical protein